MEYFTATSRDISLPSDTTSLWKPQTSYHHVPAYKTDTTHLKVEKNTHGKPPYSYATLIKYAIERSPQSKLTLSQIYEWVIEHYPYYGTAGSGWKVILSFSV